MTKNCSNCWSLFKITQSDLDFYNKISPIFNWKTYQIPPPTLCPDCRHQRKLTFRNQRNLYKRKCDATWEDIISIYSPDKSFKVFKAKYWWSDKWEPMSYWKDIDFQKSFFDQYKDLFLTIPKQALHTWVDMENCDYCNYWTWCKDCYLCFMNVWSENCLYTETDVKWLSNADSTINIGNQYCYECLHSNQCYESQYCRYSQGCKNSYFLLDCIACENCFWCVNMQHKKYCFLNKQLSKEDYESKIKQVIWDYSKIEQFKIEYDRFVLKYPRKCVRNINSENCTWDFIQNSKNSHNCFSLVWAENCKDTNLSWINCFELYSCYFTWDWATQCYESTWAWSNKIAFCFYSISNNDCYYCITCEHCSNCFGCEWLRHKKYCILNKQYSKEEYEVLVWKIIDHMSSTWEWWEFFPISMSPFCYNESAAQEYFPLEKQEIINNKWYWKDVDTEIWNVKKIIEADKLPNTLDKIPDDILSWAIKCKKSQKPFKIVSQELKFYRKYQIPIPHLSPEQRHKERISYRNPNKLWNRKCDKCSKDINTVYDPNRPEIVYCEQCYLKEIY